MIAPGLLEVTEILEHLDFEPPCEWDSWTGSTCDRSAEWIGVFSCCGLETFRCGPHRASLVAAMAAHAAKGARSIHTVCRCVVEEIRWEPLRGSHG